MSSIYVQEPPTSGKVILKTNFGDIEIELWTKEAPKACRNFIQLCQEGYYNNTIFHRIISGFIVQGGDPSGTGNGGESVYGSPFADEFHQRLKFSHRGIVAMANSGANTNGSQFFITLDECPSLERQYSIFGKVEGRTIYNVVKISEVQTNEEGRPVGSVVPQILHTDVTLNPFEDIVVRNLVPVKKEFKVPERKEEERKSKIVHVAKQAFNFIYWRNKNMLSFEDEEELEDEEQVGARKGIKSLHDVVSKEDKTISNVNAISTEELEAMQKKKEKQEKVKNTLIENVAQSRSKTSADSVIKELQSQAQQFKSKFRSVNSHLKQELQALNSEKERSRSRSQDEDESTLRKADAIKRVEERRRLRGVGASRVSKRREQESDSSSEEEVVGAREEAAKFQALQETRLQYESLKADLIQFKKAKVGTLIDEANLDVQAKISPLELHRAKYLKEMKNTKNRENETMAKLQDFQQKLKKADNLEEGNWMKNRLKFNVDSKRAYDVNSVPKQE